MNPIILYPKTAAQAKPFLKIAEEKDVEMLSVSKKIIEEFEEWLFAEKLITRSKTSKNVSRKKVMDTFERKLKELSGK